VIEADKIDEVTAILGIQAPRKITSPAANAARLPP
jgi:hypothetical protein